jgi:superfamily II DNA or RNA helicase
VLILAHRGEIIRQIVDALRDEGVTAGVIRSGEPMNLSFPVQVASIQTLVKRLDLVQKPDFIVVDESHHIASASYHAVMAAYSSAHVLGVTATPERLDGKGLGDYFQTMVRGPEVAWLIENGYLANPVYYAPSTVDLSGVHVRMGDFAKNEIAGIMEKPSIVGDAVKHYLKYASGRTAITFCVNLKHAAQVAESFNRAGVKSEVIDGTQTDRERSGIIDRLGKGETRNMVSCDLVGEGFDCPSVGAAILLRPTASLGLHLQQLGRSLRAKSDGGNAIILDHVGNCVRHGLAEEEREWSLEGSASKRRKRESALETRTCENCFAVFTGTVCPQCQTERESKVREIEQKEGELARLNAEAVLAARARIWEESRCKTFSDFRELGKRRGHKPGWAWHRWNTSKWNKREENKQATDR